MIETILPQLRERAAALHRRLKSMKWRRVYFMTYDRATGESLKDSSMMPPRVAYNELILVSRKVHDKLHESRDPKVRSVLPFIRYLDKPDTWIDVEMILGNRASDSRGAWVKEIWVGARQMFEGTQDDVPEELADLLDDSEPTYFIDEEREEDSFESDQLECDDNAEELDLETQVEDELRKLVSMGMFRDPETDEIRTLRSSDSIQILVRQNEDLDSFYMDEPKDEGMERGWQRDYERYPSRASGIERAMREVSWYKPEGTSVMRDEESDGYIPAKLIVDEANLRLAGFRRKPKYEQAIDWRKLPKTKRRK